MEIASDTSQSHTGSGGDSSQFPWIEEGGSLGGMELEDELMFNLMRIWRPMTWPSGVQALQGAVVIG